MNLFQEKYLFSEPVKMILEKQQIAALVKAIYLKLIIHLSGKWIWNRILYVAQRLRDEESNEQTYANITSIKFLFAILLLLALNQSYLLDFPDDQSKISDFSHRIISRDGPI